MAGILSNISRRLLDVGQVPKDLLREAMLEGFTTPEDAAPTLPQAGVLSTVADLPEVSNFKPAKGPGVLERMTRTNPDTGEGFWDRLGHLGATLEDAGGSEGQVAAYDEGMARRRAERAALAQKNKTDAYVASRNDPALTEMYTLGGSRGLFDYLKDEATERRTRERPEFKVVGGKYGTARNGAFEAQGDVSPTPGEVFTQEDRRADNEREAAKAAAEAEQRNWLRGHQEAELRARERHDRATEGVAAGNLALGRAREGREASTLTTDRVVARVLDKQQRGEALTPNDQAVLDTYKGLRARQGGSDGGLEELLGDVPPRPVKRQPVARQPAPARPAVNPAGAAIAPVRIRSQADFDSLKPGTRFIDPATGRPMTKMR
jgi:hypothetical protein